MKEPINFTLSTLPCYVPIGGITPFIFSSLGMLGDHEAIDDMSDTEVEKAVYDTVCDVVGSLTLENLPMDLLDDYAMGRIRELCDDIKIILEALGKSGDVDSDVGKYVSTMLRDNEDIPKEIHRQAVYYMVSNIDYSKTMTNLLFEKGGLDINFDYSKLYTLLINNRYAFDDTRITFKDGTPGSPEFIGMDFPKIREIQHVLGKRRTETFMFVMGRKVRERKGMKALNSMSSYGLSKHELSSLVKKDRDSIIRESITLVLAIDLIAEMMDTRYNHIVYVEDGYLKVDRKELRIILFSYAYPIQVIDSIIDHLLVGENVPYENENLTGLNSMIISYIGVMDKIIQKANRDGDADTVLNTYTQIIDELQWDVLQYSEPEGAVTTITSMNPIIFLKVSEATNLYKFQSLVVNELIAMGLRESVLGDEEFQLGVAEDFEELQDQLKSTYTFSELVGVLMNYVKFSAFSYMHKQQEVE